LLIIIPVNSDGGLFYSLSQVADSAEGEGAKENASPFGCRLELAFEYLVAKNTLKWITLYSNQVD
jgi:hypothetical protein